MNTSTTTQATAGPTDPFDYYGTVADVDNTFGPDNVTSYSVLQGDRNVRNNSRLQYVMKQASEWIDGELNPHGIGRPDTGIIGFVLLTQAWAWMVGALLYRSKGMLEVQTDTQGNVTPKAWEEEARKLVRKFIHGYRGRNFVNSQKIGDSTAARRFTM